MATAIIGYKVQLQKPGIRYEPETVGPLPVSDVKAFADKWLRKGYVATYFQFTGDYKMQRIAALPVVA